MEFFIPAVLFIVAMFFIVFFTTQQRKNIRKYFSILGEELGLKLDMEDIGFFSSLFRDAHPELNGSLLERFPVRIYMFSRGSGKHRKNFIAFDLSCRNHQRQRLILMREGIFRKIGKAMGMQQDIEVRDPEFDSRFIIKTSNHLFAKQILADPDLREVFLQHQHAFQTAALKLDGDNIHFEIQATLSSRAVVNQIESMLELSVLMAQRLEEMHEGPSFEMN
jgi:hypothetical protein